MLINLHLKNNLAFKKGEREDLICRDRLHSNPQFEKYLKNVFFLSFSLERVQYLIMNNMVWIW